MRVFVTDDGGKFIPSYGTRQAGEFFDLPDDVAKLYEDRDGFSLSDPNPPKKTSKSKSAQTEDDES